MHFSRLLLPLLLLNLLVACNANKGNGENSNSPDSLTQQTAAPLDDRDRERKLHSDIDHGGHHYTIDITSSPDASLPKVKDSYGEDYLDNRFLLLIHRDGQEWARHSLTKADFLHLPLPQHGQSLILGGIAFKEISAGDFCFGAQLNTPGNEEGGVAFEIRMALSQNASPRIQLDTNPDIENIHSDEATD